MKEYYLIKDTAQGLYFAGLQSEMWSNVVTDAQKFASKIELYQMAQRVREVRRDASFNGLPQIEIINILDMQP